MVGTGEVLKLDYLYLLERELKKEVFSDQSSILKLGHLQVPYRI